MMDYPVIIFPEFEQLKIEVEKLRTELSMLVLEKDTLRFTECKNIETAYMLELGAVEYKVYEAQCLYFRLKRKADMIQAKINRQENVDEVAIEETLDTEFAEYKAKLEEQINRMNDALDRSKLPRLSPEESADLKKTYRRIVKALHPDLHPESGDEKIELFRRAVTAYENGDLTSLKIIDEMVSEQTFPEYHEDALDALRQERLRLLELVKSVQADIQTIKSRFPYTVKELVYDPQKVQAKKAEFENDLAQYKSAIELLNQRIIKMLENHE